MSDSAVNPNVNPTIGHPGTWVYSHPVATDGFYFNPVVTTGIDVEAQTEYHVELPVIA